VAAAVLTAAAAARLEAAPTPDRTLRCGNPVPITRATWPAPLDRRVALVIDGITLREALTRVSAQAGVRLTYIAELLPLDRTHCLALSQVTVGDALAALLVGSPVAAVAAGRDQVVLAPTTAESRARAQAAVRVGTLDRVIVTGRANRPTAVSTMSIDVIDGRALEARGATTLASALNGIVPGLWISSPTPGAATVRMASLRGASSFGASAPKVYIDGIEVANPLVLTQLRPETVDRVEVIRGPQGSALYGADAIGGVLQITTRHDPINGTSTSLRTSAGVAPRDGGGSVATQDHTLQLRTGNSARAGGITVSTSRIGDYVARGATQQWNAAGDLRVVGTRRTLIASARVFSQEAGNPNFLTGSRVLPSAPRGEVASTDGRDGVADLGRPTVRQAATVPNATVPRDVSIAPQTAQQYTIGAVLTETGAKWTTRVVGGVDGYRLANPIVEPGLAGSSADSALRAASGAADRLSLRVSSIRNATVSDNINATVTLGGEHSSLRDASNVIASSNQPTALLRHSTGLLAKTDLSWGERLFVTAGGRVESNLGYSTLSQLSFLPSVGAALIETVGSAAVTLRSSWGRAIRPPRTPGLASGVAVARPTLIASLEPEVQSGFETGVEIAFGSSAQLTVTRFDQRASGLIQASLVTADLAPWRNGPRRTVTALQNVGVIANQGWEFTGRAQRGAIGAVATVSTVSSTVARVVPGYLGDLRRGDRMLDVPALTAGLTLDWTAPMWSASVGASRASNWIGYDRAAIARDLASGARTPEQLAGLTLRRYWRSYEGVNRLRASLTHELTSRLTLSVHGENLLDVRVGEPDNLTMLPGRTLSAGLRARF
jgi:iron complex outermembrane recepter protein